MVFLFVDGIVVDGAFVFAGIDNVELSGRAPANWPAFRVWTQLRPMLASMCLNRKLFQLQAAFDVLFDPIATVYFRIEFGEFGEFGSFVQCCLANAD